MNISPKTNLLLATQMLAYSSVNRKSRRHLEAQDEIFMGPEGLGLLGYTRKQKAHNSFQN